METTGTSQTESANTARGRASAAAKLEDLLGSNELGVIVRGIVLVLEEVTHLTGTGKGGKPYNFYSRRAQVHCGDVAGTVVVSETADSEEGFLPLRKYVEASFSIEGARMDGRQMVMRGKLLKS